MDFDLKYKNVIFRLFLIAIGYIEKKTNELTLIFKLIVTYKKISYYKSHSVGIHQPQRDIPPRLSISTN